MSTCGVSPSADRAPFSSRNVACKAVFRRYEASRKLDWYLGKALTLTLTLPQTDYDNLREWGP